MTLFGRIKSSRQAAKENRDKELNSKVKAIQQEKESGESPAAKAPYKHIPKHAAVDALNGAPPSWNHMDGFKIKEEHRRRSQLILDRQQSAISLRHASVLLATTGQPASQISSPLASPAVSRGNSYSQINPTWNDRTGDVNYSHGHKLSGIIPSSLGSSVGLASHEASPINSRGGSSSSSSENLEMAAITKTKVQPQSSNRDTSDPAMQQPEMSSSSSSSVIDRNSDETRATEKNIPGSQRPQTMVYPDQAHFVRLHKSVNRKLGEAPLYDIPHVKPKAHVTITTQAVVIPTVPQQKAKAKAKGWNFLGQKNASSTLS